MRLVNGLREARNYEAFRTPGLPPSPSLPCVFECVFSKGGWSLSQTREILRRVDPPSLPPARRETDELSSLQGNVIIPRTRRGAAIASQRRTASEIGRFVGGAADDDDDDSDEDGEMGGGFGASAAAAAPADGESDEEAELEF